jgi:hypothetical protein
LEKHRTFRFLDYTVNPVWIGDIYKPTKNTTYDSGKTWHEENDQLLYGAYFFLAEDKIMHSRNLYNVSDLMEDFGGFYQTFIISLFMFIGSKLNHGIMVVKLIRSLFYIPKHDS